MAQGSAPKIILLGGSSSVGKTTAARALAAKLGATHVEVDRTWPDHPGRALAHDRSVWKWSTEALLEVLIAKARYLAPRIVAWCNEQREGSMVLEGEGIEPTVLREIDRTLDVRAAFIIELDAARLRKTLQDRSKSFHTLTDEEQLAVAAMNARYNHRLREQATAHEQPWLSSQPWETLVVRIHEVVRAKGSIS